MVQYDAVIGVTIMCMFINTCAMLFVKPPEENMALIFRYCMFGLMTTLEIISSFIFRSPQIEIVFILPYVFYGTYMFLENFTRIKNVYYRRPEETATTTTDIETMTPDIDERDADTGLLLQFQTKHVDYIPQRDNVIVYATMCFLLLSANLYFALLLDAHDAHMLIVFNFCLLGPVMFAMALKSTLLDLTFNQHNSKMSMFIIMTIIPIYVPELLQMTCLFMYMLPNMQDLLTKYLEVHYAELQESNVTENEMHVLDADTDSDATEFEIDLSLSMKREQQDAADGSEFLDFHHTRTLFTKYVDRTNKRNVRMRLADIPEDVYNKCVSTMAELVEDFVSKRHKRVFLRNSVFVIHKDDDPFKEILCSRASL